MLQEEINLMSYRKNKDALGQSKRGSVSGSLRAPTSSSHSKKNIKAGRLNMTVDQGDHMPPIERASSRLSQGNMKRVSPQLDSRFLKSSKDKLFSLENDEDKQIMEDIDHLETEQLRINLLQMYKKNQKLENNLEAVKVEMSSKISHLRRDNDQTQKLGNSKRPDSTLSRQSHQSHQSSKKNEEPNMFYQQKLDEMRKDNEESYQRITVLESELQNQEKFFKTKLKLQYDQSNKAQEDSIMGESKFVNLMDKLSVEQSNFYADKKRNNVIVKDTVEAAQQKVHFIIL
jgi:hypothetical protein